LAFRCAHSVLTKIQKGVSSARSDDTKTLKSVIIDWITPRGQVLDPPLARNIKTDRGFNHDFTGRLLCPAGLDWSDKEYAIFFLLKDRRRPYLTTQRIRECLRQGDLHVSGEQWPIFLYHDYSYDPDNPWKGLLRSSLVVSVSSSSLDHSY
jgi:hypothetical protein